MRNPMDRRKRFRFLGRLAGAIPILIGLYAGPVAADSGELGAKDAAIYRRAFAALAEDRWQDAIDIAAGAKNPLLAKVVHWLDLTRPGPGRSFDAMNRFLQENPDWPQRETLLAQAERAMPETYPSAKILAWFGERKPLTAAGALKLANALMAGKAEQRARDIVRAAWIERDFSEAEETEFLDRFGRILGPADHAARMDRLLWRKKTEQAERLLPRLDAAERALGLARLKLAADAEDALSAVASVPAEKLRVPGLVVDLARYYRRAGDKDKAIALFAEVPRQAGRGEEIWSELERASRAALAAGDAANAYRLAAAHGGETGESFIEGEFLAGWIALRFLDRADVALDHFARLHAGAKTVLTRARAAYWAGRAELALGHKSEAQSWYEKAAANRTVFYGQLAALSLPGAKPAIPFPKKTQPDPHWRDREMAKIMRQLGQIGEAERIRPFAMALLRQAKTPADFAAIAAIAIEAKARDVAVMVAKEARAQGVELPEYLFPIIKLPPGKNVEPALVLGVIRQESVFDADIVSPAGAMGLMQLMPATAKPLAKELGVKKFKTKMLVEDAILNMRLGRLYLANLIEDFGGSYVLAIASYNAGPARAREWIAANGDPRAADVDVVDWIEAIPFDETRNYVMRVLENLEVYRARLNPGATLALMADLRRGAVP